MPADPPFIIPSAHPFKVEATPSKMGGVNALAKRPLDMSGQADPMTEHLEPVLAESLHPDTRATLPSETPDGQGGEGPVLQEQIDTSHREYFDDPSRYLRTDVVVRLPGAGASSDESAEFATTPEASVVSDASTGPMANGMNTPAARIAARKARAGQPTQQAPHPSRGSGGPQQRRDAFNERLAGLMVRQQQIHEELSAVEQAVQATRATREQSDPSDKPV